MKTKIIIAGIISLSAFTFSSFRSKSPDQKYHSITKTTSRNIELHKIDAFQTAVNCAKCHDCQKETSIVQDSTAVSNRNYHINVNTNIEKASLPANNERGQEKPEWKDDKSPDNLKTN